MGGLIAPEDASASLVPAVYASDRRPGLRSPRGVRVLHDYLRYAQDGTWAVGRPTEREADSDFEVAVANALRMQGYEVHLQVGVAGYRIDLAVVHPRRSGMYVLGIECDGAQYHAAKSARDRDRLRQLARWLRQ